MNFKYLLLSLFLFVIMFYTGAYKNIFYMCGFLSICVPLVALGTASEEGRADLVFSWALIKNDHAKSLEIVMLGLEKNWTDLRLFTTGTTIAIQLNEIDKAEAFAKRAFLLDSKHPDTALALFLVKAHRNQIDDAEIWAQHVLLKDTQGKYLVYSVKFKMYFANENFDKALEALNELEKLDSKFFPKHQINVSRVALLIRTNKVEEALVLSRKNHDEWFANLSLKNGSVLDQSLGEALVANQMWLAASEAYSRAYQNNPDECASLVQRAGCYCALREFDKAKADLDEFDPKNKDEDLKKLSDLFRKTINEQ